MAKPMQPWLGIAAAALLVLTSAGAVAAQAEIEPSGPEPTEGDGPGIAEVALCQMPELGERAGSGGPLIASVADDLDLTIAPTGSEGCMAPQTEMPDAFTGQPHMMFYVNDFASDGGPDVTRAFWGPTELSGPAVREARSNEDISVVGQRNKVLGEGEGTLVCVELDEPLQPGEGVHIATDVKDNANGRAPSGVGAPDNPFANVREVMSFVLRDDGTPFAGASDLAKGFDYTAKHPFAAWQEGAKVFFFAPAGALGADFRVVTSGPDGNADVAGLGSAPGLLVTNGLFGWQPGCVDNLLTHEPLVIDGASTSFSKTIASYCFLASAGDLEIVGRFMEREGDDLFGIAPVGFSLREEGQKVRQEPSAGVVVVDGRIYVLVPIGLKAYGFHAITDLQFEPSGDADVDGVLAKAALAIARWTNPFMVDATPGFVQDVPCLDGVPLPEMPWG